MSARLLALLLLLPWSALADQPTDATDAPDPTDGTEPSLPPDADEPSVPLPPSAPFPLDLHDLSELSLPQVARISASGRVGAGLVVNGGSHVVTLLTTVRVGYPAAVQVGSGHSSLARVVAWDRLHGIALLALDDAVEGAPVPVFGGQPRVGQAVVAFGHGGSVGLSIYDEDLRGLTMFTPLPLTVLAQRLSTEEEREARVFPDFLVDRPPGEGDRGAPVVNAAGEVVGLLREAIADGAGRTLVLPSAAITDLLEAPQDRKYRRPSHLQSWMGTGIAAHNRPSMVGGLVRLGFRVAVLDALRIEPWAEATLGTRAPFVEQDEDGGTVGSRDRDLWWSIEAGIDAGYRIPIPVEGSRDYIVPNVGLRLGWNRFQHAEETLTARCEGNGCLWETVTETDQVREFRAGIDLGIDVRHGGVRFGYRFFLDPTDVAAHSMHRLLITFDGFPLDIAVGDSR